MGERGYVSGDLLVVNVKVDCWLTAFRLLMLLHTVFRRFDRSRCFTPRCILNEDNGRLRYFAQNKRQPGSRSPSFRGTVSYTSQNSGSTYLILGNQPVPLSLIIHQIKKASIQRQKRKETTMGIWLGTTTQHAMDGNSSEKQCALLCYYREADT